MTMRERWGGQPFDRHALELWLRSARGRRLIELEEAELARTMPELFGRHFLQIGSWGHGNRLIASSQMLHNAVLGTVRGFEEQALAAPEHLPVMAKSVDAVLLPHCLEFVRSPQSVLREVNRVLTDRGRVLILGFNPWSLWGLRQTFGLRYRAFPQGARLVSVRRLQDWLELLDFEVCELRRFGIGFPWIAPHSEGLGNVLQRAFDGLADCYLVVAKKRVIPMTLVGRRVRAAVPAIVPAPATEARRTMTDPT
jgi:SAM-dependent methyltransferase